MSEWILSGTGPTGIDRNGRGSELRPRRYRPAVPLALALATGIFLADRLGWSLYLWSAFAVCCAVAWLIAQRFSRWPWLSLLALLALLLAAGAFRYQIAVTPSGSADVSRLTGTRSKIATLTGILLHEPRTTYPPPGVYFAVPDHVITSKFRMRVEEATVEGKRFDVSGCVAVRVRGPRPRDSVGKMPNAGDRVVVLGLLSGTRPPANPGEFDLARFYRRTGVGAVLWGPNWDAVRIVQRSADGFRHTLGRIRRFALRGLELAPDARSRAVLEAIVLGRRDRLEDAAANGGGAMPEEQLELAFIKTGTAHFLAVSGLHVGMMAAFLAFVLRRLFVPRRVAAIVVIVFVMFYACLAQFRPSAVRAGIVISVMCLGWILGRRSDMLNSVAAAAILILLVSPVDLFMTGFQFSFLIMVGILFVGPELEKFFFRRSMEIEALLDEPYVSSPWYPWKRRIRFTLTSCTAAALLAIPLASYTFHVVVLWGPVISLFVLPLFYLILILAFGMILTGWWLPAVATLFGYVAQGFCAGLLWLLMQVSNIPYTFSYISGFSWPWLLGAYGVIVLWIWRERLKLSRRRLVLVALAFSAAFVWFGLPETKRDGMRVTFLAVGSANINVIQLPNGRTILYDAGASYSATRATAYSIAPALWALGVDRIDAVLLSHPHFDHFKEILQIAERFPIGRVYVPRSFMRDNRTGDNRVVEDLFAAGIPVSYIAPGDALQGLGDVEMEVLWPSADVDEEWTLNDGSLVVRFAFGGHSVLLTGDIEAAGIDALLRRGMPRCDVVLWPHHGAESDSVHELFRQTGCNTVVISAPRIFIRKEQRTGQSAEWRLFHTGFDGSVTVDFRRRGVEVRTFRGQRANP